MVKLISIVLAQPRVRNFTICDAPLSVLHIMDCENTLKHTIFATVAKCKFCPRNLNLNSPVSSHLMPKINVGEFCVFYFWRGRCCIKVERSSFKRSSALSCWIFLVSLCQILPIRDLSTPMRLWNIFSLWLTHKNDSVASLLPSKHPPDASEQPLRQMKYEGRSGSAAVSPNSYTTASMLILLDGRRELNCFLKSLHEKCNGTRAYFHYLLDISVSAVPKLSVMSSWWLQLFHLDKRETALQTPVSKGP